MSTASYLLGILAALLTLGVVIEMLRRRRLRERHAIWWLVAGTLALLVGVFPAVLDAAAAAVGVGVPTNLVFFVSIAVLFLVCIQHSAELTSLESQTRALAESTALQEIRIAELEYALSTQRRTLVENAAEPAESLPARGNDPLTPPRYLPTERSEER